MRRSLSVPLVLFTAGLTGAGLIAPSTAAPDAESPTRIEEVQAQTLRVEAFSEAGPAGYVEVPVTAVRARRVPLARAAVNNWQVTGSPKNRYDVTITGDGYTKAQLDNFVADAKRAWSAMVKVEPYASYAGMFNVRIAKVASQQSGITNDQNRDTAYGSYYNCGGTQRLICTDLQKVRTRLADVPTDFVLLLANSTEYGGAGYYNLRAQGYPFAGVSTMASDNAQSALVAVHESGHSIGGLGDEYGGYTTAHPGPEPAWPNLSLKTANKLTATKQKWWRWIGRNDPTGGVVRTFEGGDYYDRGVYRPTAGSLMRGFDVPIFNSVGREQLIGALHRDAKAVTRRTPAGHYGVKKELIVKRAKLPRAGLANIRIRWFVNGREKKKARNLTRFVPARYGVRTRADGYHTVTVRVVDRTRAVRAPEIRKRSRTNYSWKVG